MRLFLIQLPKRSGIVLIFTHYKFFDIVWWGVICAPTMGCFAKIEKSAAEKRPRKPFFKGFWSGF